MERPRVVIHNATCLDGRLDGFPVDPGLYYEPAAGIPHEAVLTGLRHDARRGWPGHRHVRPDATLPGGQVSRTSPLKITNTNTTSRTAT
jgi:hypothetical protein